MNKENLEFMTQHVLYCLQNASADAVREVITHLNTVLKSNRLPVRQSSVVFYEALYDKIGQQIESQKDFCLFGVMEGGDEDA